VSFIAGARQRILFAMLLCAACDSRAPSTTAPTRSSIPLLETGQQTFTGYQEDLGFVGNPAILSIEVTITDVTGKNRIVTATTSCDLFAKPVVRHP
jgi:hypothetical protein